MDTSTILDILVNLCVNFFFTGKLIRFTNGKTGYLLQKYTFCKQGVIRKGTATRWVCSQNTKCSVYIHLDNNYKLLYKNAVDHTHKPPELVEVGTNLYVKL